MRLNQLRAENFRLFRELSLQPHRRLNFVLGANAAGKTSLLEAIYVLGRGRSFRGSAAAELAGAAGAQWLLFGRVQAEDSALARSLGVRWSDSQTEVRVDGQSDSSVGLLRAFPVQVLEPGMHRLLQEGPSYRRSFVDWGVFHVEPSYLGLWRRYRRALQQRGQLLRQNASDRELAAWEPELAEAGEAVAAMRARHLEALRAPAITLIDALLAEGSWNLELQPGWPRGIALAEALARQRSADRRAGLTQSGPHRAELRIRAGERAVKHQISRGQQKLLIAALLLAQCHEIGAVGGQHPVLLVDDFAAELAEPFQAALLGALQRYPGQVFLTAFERSGVLAQPHDASMFHVERGVVRALS